MRTIIFTIFVLAVLLVGCSACSTDKVDNPMDNKDTTTGDEPLADVNSVSEGNDFASDAVDNSQNALDDW